MITIQILDIFDKTITKYYEFVAYRVFKRIILNSQAARLDYLLPEED